MSMEVGKLYRVVNNEAFYATSDGGHLERRLQFGDIVLCVYEGRHDHDVQAKFIAPWGQVCLYMSRSLIDKFFNSYFEEVK